MTDTPFLALGKSIAAARIRVGLKTQLELAGLLGVKQQSVSRWEAGTHRPKADQLPAIAGALKLRLPDLRELAGDKIASAASFVKPFPVDQLLPDEFELFVADLAKQKFSDAQQVRRAGSTGHKQDGLDVRVLFAEGKTIDLQCKRKTRFGPADVAAAVKAYTGSADKRILVLSRVASPQTAEAVRQQPDWELWDKDDISREVRDLPIIEQERLVDRYFRGQRLTLLGRHEPGPWMTDELFFMPFADKSVALSHDWQLLGRTAETTTLIESLQRQIPLIFVCAPGGLGKSRILKEVVEKLENRQGATLIRFLSSGGEVTRSALETLGPAPKVLIVDDAHDRDGLSVLFEYASVPANQTCLMMATRPYALERLKAEAARYNISSPTIVSLTNLNAAELKKLVEEVLSYNHGPQDFADAIVSMCGGSPLIAAMAARVVAKENVPLEKAKNSDEFRTLILGRFTDVLIGNLDKRGGDKVLQSTLEVLALVQPFHPEDKRLLALLQDAKGIDEQNAATALNKLIGGGIIYRRGNQWRLMPDILGDYIIEQSCVGALPGLTPFAAKVLTSAEDALLRNAIVNLGRLDWRRNDGETAESMLLNNVWKSFEDIINDYDPRLDAIKSVAIFQPEQALEFVTRQIRQGRALKALPDILNQIAFTGKHLDEIYKLLWQLGRSDDGRLGANPGHPIRVLTELAGYGRNKPLYFAEHLLDFACNLGRDPANWRFVYTPLDLLKPLLSLEQTDTTSDGRQISFSTYLVNYDAVKAIRQKAIDYILRLMVQGDAIVAHQAAQGLSETIRRPHALMRIEVPKVLLDKFDDEFSKTLDKVRDVVVGNMNEMVKLAIGVSIAWHTEFGLPKTKKAAQAIIEALPRDPKFNLLAAMTSGITSIRIIQSDAKDWETQANNWQTKVVSELKATVLSPEQQLDLVVEVLDQIKSVNAEPSYAHSFLVDFIKDDLPFSKAVLERALSEKDSVVAKFANIALSQLFRSDRTSAAAYVKRMMASNDPMLKRAIADGYAGHVRDPFDQTTIAELLNAEELWVVQAAIRSVWLSDLPEDETISLLIATRVGNNARLVDDIAMAFCGGRRNLMNFLSETDAAALLKQIQHIPQLEGHWIDTILAELSFRFPQVTAEFFMNRVEIAAATNSFNFRPANYGPWSQQKLRFLQSGAGTELLEAVWRWLKKNTGRDLYFQHAAKHAFEAMFLGDTDVIVEFLQPLIDSSTSEELKLMAELLREADNNFVFRHTAFVISILERCQIVDLDLLDHMTSELYCSAISGVRTSLVGEPSATDLSHRDNAEQVLGRISRVSPAYDLYDAIKQAADNRIRSALADGERFDE